MCRKLFMFGFLAAAAIGCATVREAQVSGTVSPSGGKIENPRAARAARPRKNPNLLKNIFRVLRVSGDRSQITLSFTRDLDIKQAKRTENYRISPADVGQMRIMVVGKYVTLSGLKLKKGKKYQIRIAPAVKDAKGGVLPEANRTAEFIPVYEKRKIRVSAVQPLQLSEWEKHYNTGKPGRAGYIEYVEELVAEAGQMGSDIVCLPEAVDLPWKVWTIPGPYFDRLAKKARKHSMYVIAHQSEKEVVEGKPKYHSIAFIIDRQGKLLGKYRKVHRPGWRNTGNTFPVFQTDFGKIGIMVCWDGIAFPECARLLALNGAEIIFFPHKILGSSSERDVVMGSQGQALANGVYIVPCHFGRLIDDSPRDASRSFGRTCVVAPDGYIVADTGYGAGIASAVIDLEKKRLGVGWGFGGICDTKDSIFSYRRPAVYGGLAEEKNPLPRE